MTKQRSDAVSVARCAHREMQRATIAEYDATPPATLAQRTGLKDLALRVLGRNVACNAGATPPEKPRNAGATVGVASATDSLRATLHALATSEGVDAALVDALPDVEACVGLPDDALRAYLRALRDSADRMAGRVPADETSMALCRGCGPVWVAPEVADAAPKVGGWARLLGCTWCHVRHAGLFVPRPPVECDGCRDFARDAINPDGGMGRCTAGHKRKQGEPMPYPHAKRQCDQFNPAPPGWR